MLNKSRCVLAVRSLNASVPYYRDVLGMTVDLEPPGWSIAASALGDHSYFAYVTVTDASALFQEFKSRAVEFTKPLFTGPWGMREFGIQTPDGHRIMFGQELAASES